MFHIHIVDRSNRGAYRDQLEQHFRLRHELYLGERGWLDLARSDGREMAALDIEDAVCPLGILPGRDAVGGSILDRESVVLGKSVYGRVVFGGCRIINKKQIL